HGTEGAGRRVGTLIQSLPMITSDALMMALASSPTLRASSSAASIVIDAVMMAPPTTEILTRAVVTPATTSTTFPLSTFRALILTLTSSVQYPRWRAGAAVRPTAGPARPRRSRRHGTPPGPSGERPGR